MAKRMFRGDAPTQALKWRIHPPLNEGTVKLRVGNKTLSFAAWSATAIAAAWNASKWPELTPVTATASGNDLVLTADTAGEPFFVWITVGDDGVGEGTGTNEVQTVYLINTPTGGTFNIAFDGDDADVAYDASTGTLQTALEGLTTLDAGDVTVTGSTGGPWTCTFGGRFAGANVPALEVDGTNLTGGTALAVIQTLQNGGGSGTTSTQTKDPLDAAGLFLVNGVTGSLTDSLGLGYDATFNGTTDAVLAHQVLQFTVELAQGVDVTAAKLVMPLDAITEGDVIFAVSIEDADNPAFPTTYADALGRPLMAGAVNKTIPIGTPAGNYDLTGLGALIQAALNRPGWASGHKLNLHLRSSTASGAVVSCGSGGYLDGPQLAVTYSTAAREVQTVALAGNPRGGTVELTLDTETTAALDHDSSAADVQAELEALSNVGAGNVECTGGPWPSTITCSFANSLGDLPQMTATDTLVNGDVQVATDTAGGAAIDIVEEARSRGPNHIDDELNWQDDTGAFGLPDTGDEIYLPAGKVDALYGLRWRSAFTADAATNRLLVDGQCALRDGQKVRVLNVGGALPGGLSAGTDYYVRDRDGVFLRLATSLGGAAVNISSAGTGTHTVGVRLAYVETDARYTGKLGLPRRTKGDFEEYRPRFLEAWADAIKLGRGNGSGSARTNLDTRGVATSLQLIASAGGQNNEPAVQWLGDGAGNALEVLGGDLGVAVDPDQAAEFDALKLRSGNVLIGRDVACGDIDRTGGTIRMLGATVDGTVTL